MTRCFAPRQPATSDRHRQRGHAVVEFALILPILLVLLIGSIDVSLALYSKTVITNASREGARAGIVARNPPLTEWEIWRAIDQYAQSAQITLDKNKVGITKVNSPNGDPALRVTVGYTFQGIGLGSLLQSLNKTLELQATTTMVYE